MAPVAIVQIKYAIGVEIDEVTSKPARQTSPADAGSSQLLRWPGCRDHLRYDQSLIEFVQYSPSSYCPLPF